MSALDQAFIKAYSHRAEVRAAARTPVTDAAVPAPAAAGEPRAAAPSAPALAVGKSAGFLPAKASQRPTPAAAIERLFTNLARPAEHLTPAAREPGPTVSARETLGLVPPPSRTAAPPPAAVAPPPNAILPPTAEAPAMPPFPLSLWPTGLDEPGDSLESLAAKEPPAEAATTPAEVTTDATAETTTATAIATATATWRPMLQVDHFLWPRICQQLHSVAVRQMEELADALLAAAGTDHKVLAVGGIRPGDGATTMLLCAGRLLAERGFRVLLADADFADPQLARQLGMAPEAGWETVMAGRLPLEEVIIDSTADRLAVLPTLPPASAGGGANAADDLAGKANALAAGLDVLRQHYDFVLVDVGPLADRAAAGLPALGSGSRLEAAVVVHNPQTAGAERLAEVQDSLAAAGVAQIGIIQNFVRL
jgi:Mrp family chromosome partitioning ATPase